MSNICPICKYSNLFEKPYNDEGYGSYEICPCCGFQFGYDDYPDKENAIKKWREKWIEGGYKWNSKNIKPPINWNPYKQLPVEK